MSCGSRATAGGCRSSAPGPGTGGTSWCAVAGLRYPAVRHHADAGLDNQLAFLRSALDWVAENTPRDRETRYLEARVTAWHNADPPRVEVFRSGLREGAGVSATAVGRPRPLAALAALDELLGRRVSLRSLALLRVLAGPAVLLHLRPFLADSLDGRTYSDAFYEPYAAWYPQLPDVAYVALLWLAAASAIAMSIGLLTRVATATTFALVAYNLFLSTTHFHNNRAYLVIVLGLLAVAPCGRELSLDAMAAPAPRAPGAGRAGTRMAAVAAALRVQRGLRSVGAEQAAGSRLVRRHRHVAARRARPRRPGGLAAARLGGVAADQPRLPHGRRQVRRPDRAVHRGSGCGGARRATRPSGSRSCSTSRSRAPRPCRCSRSLRSRCW